MTCDLRTVTYIFKENLAAIVKCVNRNNDVMHINSEAALIIKLTI